ncbi:MAG: type II toxin-antitoxin system VapC family toxin [Candidatus Dormibacteria bacterium]
MILIDSSAWVGCLRDTGSPVCEEVDRLLGAEIATSDPVLMEVLAGARDTRHLGQLRALPGRAQMRHCRAEDYETAAHLYRSCRDGGETVRQLVDCLIAAVAIREELLVLHQNQDFSALARHPPLRVHQV